MKIRDIAVVAVLLLVAKAVPAQEVDFRLQGGVYLPLSPIADHEVGPSGEIRSAEQLRAAQLTGGLVLWWTRTIGTSITGAVANPDVRDRGVRPDDPEDPFDLGYTWDRRENYMQVQLSVRGVLRVLQVGRVAADASVGGAYTHFAAGPFHSDSGSSAWSPVVGLDLAHALTPALSASVGTSITRYDLPGPRGKQTDARVGLGLQFRLLPWPN